MKSIEEFKRKPAVICCASQGGEGALFILKKYGVTPAVFCDNSPSKHGTEFFGVPVISTEEAVSRYKETGASYTIGSITYFAALRSQLISLGVDEDDIYYYQTVNIFLEDGQNILPKDFDAETDKRIKDYMLKILIDVHDFCEEHNVLYYIFYGTLLGAVRHKGYIPWDDDIDILMFRDDFERFFALLEKHPIPGIRIRDPLKTPYASQTEKSVYLENSLIQRARPYGIKEKSAIYIDIFVLDDIKKRNGRFQYFQKRFKNTANQAMLYKSGCPMLHTDEWKPLARFLTLFPKKFINKLVLFVVTFNNHKNAKYVHHFFPALDYWQTEARTWERTLFDERVLLEFEGHMFWAPKHYDRMLTDRYGDYMELPPENQRVPHNDFYMVQFPDEG